MTIEELLKKLQEDISWLGYNETEREIITHIQCAMKYLEKAETDKLCGLQECNDKEVNDRLDKTAICKNCSACFLSSSQGSIFLAVQ